MKKPDYPIPTTNAEGLALVWTRIYPAELARRLSVLTPDKPLSRAGAAKWTSVPHGRVAAVSKITNLDPRHILPEMAFMFEGHK